MKHIFTSIVFCLLTMLFACEENNEVANPAWLDDWIAEIK